MEDKAAVYLTPPQKAAATTLIMAATILVVLDQTIANVALPHMQAALGATPDTISWVLTTYILATAVATPITGWLSGRIGRTPLFGIAIIGFTISSALCGMAVSLPMMVAARVAQGFFGAFLMPLSQSFLYDMNAPSNQIRAMTLWGVGVMVAPIFGPVLGGYLTESFNWRWVFFINVPIGAAAAVGIFLVMPQFPAARRAFDHAGFILIAVALCAMQLALDRGTQNDWFDSTEIIIEAGVALAAFWMLVVHLVHARNPLIPTSMFANRNFVTALALSFVVMPVMMASTALLPQLIQTLLGYPVQAAGLIMMPRGAALLVAMILAGRMMQFVDSRIQLMIGITLIALSMYLQSRFTLDMGNDLMIWSGILQGFGMGMSMGTINLMAVSTLPMELRTEGAAVYSLVRNLGASVMIAIATALLARNIQINHAEVGSSVHASSLPFLMSQIYGGDFLSQRAAAMVDLEVTRQAMMIAFIDDFWLMMWATLAMLPLILFIKPLKVAKGEPMPVSE